jgi:hypothetical protein
MSTTTTLPYLVELTDEMRTKACIIEDIVKLAVLKGTNPPNWNEFIYLYDKSVLELDELQREIIAMHKLADLVREINCH